MPSAYTPLTNGNGVHTNGFTKPAPEGFGQLKKDVIDEIKSRLRTQIQDEVRASLGSQYQDAIVSEIKEGLRDGILTQLKQELSLPSQPQQQSNAPTAPSLKDPPPSIFTAQCHPLVEEATRDVDGYYLSHWPFPDEKARKKFVAAGFPRVTCLYFPKALNDRIQHACSLLTILFLVDGESPFIIPCGPRDPLFIPENPRTDFPRRPTRRHVPSRGRSLQQ